MGPEGFCKCSSLCFYKEVLNLKQGALGQSRLTNMSLFILRLQFWFHITSDDRTFIWSTDKKDKIRLHILITLCWLAAVQVLNPSFSVLADGAWTKLKTQSALKILIYFIEDNMHWH